MQILNMYIIIIHMQLHLYKHRYSRQTPSGSNIFKPFPGKRVKLPPPMCSTHILLQTRGAPGNSSGSQKNGESRHYTDDT